MPELCLKIINGDNKTTAVSRGEGEANLVYCQEYQPGDRIILETGENGIYVWLQVDDAMGRSLVWVTGNVTYTVPFGEGRISLSPKVFCGKRHLLSARMAEAFEVAAYRNLAVNVCDQHGLEHCYPHAVANVETRNESVFAARNAIDGVTVNTCHGEWPYESWGINQREDAKLRLEFGREVEVNRIVLYLRADFPHDNWWHTAYISFSDGSELECSLKKSRAPQPFEFETKRITWLELHDMKKSDEPSPFPALTQIEVYGK